MKIISVEMEGRIDELLTVLDADIEQLRRSIDRLNELRALVVRRDDKSLHDLLIAIKTDSQKYRHNESKRQSIRAELAGVLGCSLQQMTLSKLQTIVPEHKSSSISETVTKLRTLSSTLKKEYVATILLLTDCARFNRQLLQCILNRSNGGAVIYNSSGSARRQVDAGFMNLKF